LGHPAPEGGYFFGGLLPRPGPEGAPGFLLGAFGGGVGFAICSLSFARGKG